MPRESSVLFLTSSLLDDRKLIYSDVLNNLADEVTVEVWSTSRRNAESASVWGSVPAKVRPFPAVQPFREFPFKDLRRVNGAAWDLRVPTRAREGVYRLIRAPKMRARAKLAQALGELVGSLGLHRQMDAAVSFLCMHYPRSPEAKALLSRSCPYLVISTGFNRFEEPGIIGVAKKMGLRTALLVHSFDNLTTKDRMLYDFDAYFVWSERMKAELNYLYPNTLGRPVYVVGAQQFDVFQQPEYHLTRKEFCNRVGLDPQRPVVLYALGSPNLFYGEWLAPVRIAQILSESRFHGAQLLVRPHPQFGGNELKEKFKGLPHVVVQRTAQADKNRTERFQDEAAIIDWVNTFRHADVVVNMSSTATIDAALCDRPVINLDFDPNPDRLNEELIKDVNHRWEHFKPLSESDGVWLATDYESVAEGLLAYLNNPERDRDGRQRMVMSVCGFTDGRCGQRLFEAILDVLGKQPLRSLDS